ncbi:hypothetical protein Tco_1293261 [Tanacetum coccineum]
MWGVSYDLKGDCKNCVPQSLPWRESLGLRVADSHTGNHPEDDWPLKTIRRPYSIIRKRILFKLEREAFDPEGKVRVLYALNATLRFTRSEEKSFLRNAYGGEPSVDLLHSFLKLGRAGDWLTLSNRGGADVPKALIKPITHLENWKGLKTSWKYSPKRPVIYHRGQEMDFRSFMIQEVNGEFNFPPEGGLDDNQGSLSAKYVNNETPIINTEPIFVVLLSNVANNIIDSSNTSSGDELPPVHPSTSFFLDVGEKSKAAGKRKLAADALREGSGFLTQAKKRLLSVKASCDAIQEREREREREIKRDKAYGQVNGLHNEYGRLLLEERKWANYEQTLSILHAKVEGLESKKEMTQGF